MELKNAGLKYELEAKHRMLDGERFKDGSWLIYYDEEEQGFRCHNEFSAKQVIYGLWSNYESWQVEVDWKKALSPENPRWCRVQVEDIVESVTVERINVYDPTSRLPFKNEGYSDWSSAEPVSDELAALLESEVGK